VTTRTAFLALALTSLPFVQARENPAPATYYWKSSAAGESAKLITLFCRACEDAAGSGDIPLVSVLRDSLGEVNAQNDRVSYVWLLTYSRPTWEKHVLSAVPFFYWKVGRDSPKVGKNDTKPLMNLTQPQHPIVSSAVRNVLQLAVLDPVSTSVRATTRAYRNNQLDHERLHLEEAESYLQSAPSGGEGLSKEELNTVIARLELRKTMLGGFVSVRRAAELGEDANLEQERVRARNWELLRQCADKTGLIFEPIDLVGAESQYAVLWYPVERTDAPQGVSLGPVWKLLNLRDPYAQRAHLLTVPRYQRVFDGRTVQVVPLGVYSLTYPKMPLLMIDFRDRTHLRLHELTQRAVNEITSGIVGLSRFTNWYYYIGADLYDFYASRRGAATNQQERLNCYSKFRVAVALDKNLDPNLRAAIQRRVDSLAVNPLETSPQSEMQAALERYDMLQASAANENSQISRRLEKDRRSELARFEASKSQLFRDSVFHYATLGLYTHRTSDSDFLTTLEKRRQLEYFLGFLDGLAAAGTQPEVAYDSYRIKSAVVQLSALLPEIPALDSETRDHARRTIERLNGLSADSDLKAEFLAALTSIRQSGDLSATAASAAGMEGSSSSEALP